MSATAIDPALIPTVPTDSDGASPDAGAAPITELWWLGCHGGAGVSTLAYMTGVGHDCRQVLPRTDFERLPGLGVILVCRASANGVHAAHHSLNSYLSWKHRPELLGFVAVAAGNARPSRLVRERLQVLQSQVRRLWFMPWVGGFVAAHDPADIGTPPSYQHLAAELRAMVAFPDPAAGDAAAAGRAGGD